MELLSTTCKGLKIFLRSIRGTMSMRCQFLNAIVFCVNNLLVYLLCNDYDRYWIEEYLRKS